MSVEHLARLRTIVGRRLGLSLDEGRDVELAEALARRVAGRARPNVSAYLDALDTYDDEELRALGELLTVGETYFFRTREQFDVLRDVVLPARPRSRGDDLRILSAGCSSGEEAYSLSILLRTWEHECRPSTWLRSHVRALDLNRRSLAKAEAGVYSAWSLRETGPDVRDRWFTPRGREHELRSEIKSSVTFKQQNLLDENTPLAPVGRFDVVFCRNVLMYFTPEAARAVVARFAEALAPGGVLFLGHAESLRGLSTDYAVESSHGAFYYRLERPPVDLPVRSVERRPAFVESVVTPVTSTEPPNVVPAPRAFEDALELVSLERFARALEVLSLASSPEREETRFAVLRAIAHLGMGDVEAAESRCIDLLAAGEACVEAHVVLALIAEHRGERLDAIEHHRAALYLDPAFALSHLHLGRLQRREGETKAARHELGQALELLEHEEPSRLLLFGGGFSREGLLALCRTELATLEGAS